MLHSATFRLQRRQVRGFGGSVTYTLARSRDNAPSIGGGGTEHRRRRPERSDLEAEWALSNFDRRHRSNANVQLRPAVRSQPAVAGQRRDAGRVLARTTGALTATVLARRRHAAHRARAGRVARRRAGRRTARCAPTTTGSDIVVRQIRRSISSSTPARSRVPLTGLFGTSPRNIIIGPGSRQLNAPALARRPPGRQPGPDHPAPRQQPAQRRQLRGGRHQRELADVRAGARPSRRCARRSSICGSGSDVDGALDATAGPRARTPDAHARRPVGELGERADVAVSESDRRPVAPRDASRDAAGTAGLPVGDVDRLGGRHRPGRSRATSSAA